MAAVADDPSSPRLKWSGLTARLWEMSGLKWACLLQFTLLMPHVFLLLPPPFPPKGVSSDPDTVYLVFDFASHPSCVFIWEDVLPTCCPLCLSCPLSSSFLSHIHPTYNSSHLSLSLWWSCLHTWGKMVARCVWLCHHHVTKHLNTVAGCTILVLIFMIKAS